MTAINVPGSVSVTLDHAVEVRLDRMVKALEELTIEVRSQRGEIEALADDVARLSEQVGGLPRPDAPTHVPTTDDTQTYDTQEVT